MTVTQPGLRHRSRFLPPPPARYAPGGKHYRWVVLSNTTLAQLMATLNMSSVMIAMPAIFRGIHLNPLDNGNFNYLLWMLMGYMLVTAIVVVNFGRLGDMFGRVRMYNLGFAIFTIAAICLSVFTPSGSAGALTLIILRMVQATGGSLLMANTVALLTDAFPAENRGMALGLNQVMALMGTFLGLIAGGLLSTVDWRLVFLINVPVGIIGTFWSYWMLQELGERVDASIDWWGNLVFAVGMASLLVGVTYGIRPYGGHTMGWTSPLVITTVAVGLAFLVIFVFVERRARQPMFQMHLMGIRPFVAGNIASLLSSIGRGGLMFMLTIWLQGIWLPLHGYSFTDTPLWAGIFMLPLTGGFLAAGPLSGYFSDRFGGRPFATGGMVLGALTFFGLMFVPVNFGYVLFAVVIFMNGVAFGLFAAPNTTAIMNSVPARYRGVASGMRVTFMNSGMPISIAIFFTLMIIGLSSRVPGAMLTGLTANGVPHARAVTLANMPPVSYLFAAFLGYNPLANLLGPKLLGGLSAAHRATLTSRSYFPMLISSPFKHGLMIILIFSMVMCLLAAWASWLRGGKYIYSDDDAFGEGGVVHRPGEEEPEREPATV